MSYTFPTAYRLDVDYSVVTGNPRDTPNMVWSVTTNGAPLTISDDDFVFGNDTGNQEGGDDLNQTALVDGNTVVVYADYVITYTGSDGETYEFAAIDVSVDDFGDDNDSIFFGFISSSTGSPPPVGTNLTPTIVDGNGTVTFPCFVRGSGISTPQGVRMVEELRTGDLVITRNGVQPIAWIGSRLVSCHALSDNPKLRPVRIAVGALGNQLPVRDLWVSRQHRILVSSRVSKRITGEDSVLIAAHKLTDLPGIDIDETVKQVEYFHFLFNNHEIVYSEGAPTESLYPGPEALKSLPSEIFEEIGTLFPWIFDHDHIPIPAACIPDGKTQKKIVYRAAKNCIPLLEAYMI